MLIAGFDPGGQKQFGWCVAEATPALPLTVRSAGSSSSALDAVDAAKRALGNDCPAAAGIDSPLFWVPKGERRADKVVREAIKRAGAKNAGGTVQQVNSLRGACITQGVLAAHLCRQAWPGLRITESHPKALLWLIGVASTKVPVVSIAMSHLAAFIRCEVAELSQDARDAAVAALSAWGMLTAAPSWRNLAVCENAAFMPVPMVEYWMPIGSAEQADGPDERRPGGD